MKAKSATRSTTKTSAAQTLSLPILKKDERHAGLILDADGKPLHWLILLPGEMTGTWDKAVAWAKRRGGELPTPQEQALLFANAKAQFQPAYYWSGPQHATNPAYASIASFGGGYQDYYRKADVYRARAVRRLAL